MEALYRTLLKLVLTKSIIVNVDLPILNNSMSSGEFMLLVAGKRDGDSGF